MNNNLSYFLSEYQLYTKFEIIDCYSESDIFRTTFKFFCEKDNDSTTFEIREEKNSPVNIQESPFSTGMQNVISNSTIDFNFHKHYSGVCQQCKKYAVHFLISGSTSRDKNGNKKFYIRKVGQNPAPVITPTRDVSNFLNEDDKDFYGKALKNLKYGHGIGAYAYFRRIIENEIHRIVKRISAINLPDSNKIIEALEQYKEKHQMSRLIEEITPYLPKSLKDDQSNNILKLLYDQSSTALHELSEEDCLEKAGYIDTLFSYLVKKLNEEQYEIDEIKKAIKGLK
jgi:hypothetical protein